MPLGLVQVIDTVSIIPGNPTNEERLISSMILEIIWNGTLFMVYLLINYSSIHFLKHPH